MSAISALYGSVARLRRTWYDRRPEARRRLARPVISVGNLTVGGSGKTPAVAALARLLLAIGERPGILSRGYGRRDVTDGVVVVSDGARVLEPVGRSGDEPQMLARGLPGVAVLVSPDRYLAGKVAEQLACTVLVLDDGFQHHQLARDVDLLLASAEDLEDHVLPSGRLREPLDVARAADALLVTGSADEAARVAGALGVPTVFRLVPHFEAPRPIGSSGAAPALDGRRVIAVAGIARPARFVATLRAQGWDVARTFTYPDHHWFTDRDVAAIRAAASEAEGAAVLTTEKDAMRLEGLGLDGAYLPMRLAIEPEHAFTAWLRERL